LAVLIWLTFLVGATPTQAPTKALVDKLVVQPDGTTAKVTLSSAGLQALGATLVEDYDDMAVVDLAATAADQFAEAAGLKVSLLPDHDKVLLRDYTLQSRGELPPGLEAPAFPAGAPNLYLVVLRSIPKPEWVARLEAVGRVVSYVPSNTYLLYASRVDIEAAKARQPEIVNVFPFVPEFKVLDRQRLFGPEGFSRALVQVLNEPVGQSVIDLVQADALPGTFGRFELQGSTAVIGELANDVIQGLAYQPEVLLIEPAPQLSISGERDALIVAGGFAPGGPPYKPNCGVDYYSWLSQKGLANASDIILGLLDTGLDLGSKSASQLHIDFLDTNSPAASRVVYQGYPAATQPPSPTPGPTPSDCSGHGTLVAAVMAGSGGSATGTQWSESTSCTGGTFWMGTGVAPAAKIGSSRIYGPSGSDWANVPNYVANGLANLAGLGAQVANLSSNDHAQGATGYTSFAQMLDGRVRDATGIGLEIPISITVTSSNEGPDAVKDPAPAKNVITVGASEGYNPYYDSTSCGGVSNASNAFDVWVGSCNGSRSDTADLPPTPPPPTPTPDARDKRVKPDVVAPGTRVMGARSQAWSSGCWFAGLCSPNPIMGTGNAAIAWSGGTSFAAPGAAGAAGLVGKWYKGKHLGRWPSPAMQKAMLINSARDIAGGVYGGVPVDHIPSRYQGWGKVELARAFPTTNTYFDLDQTWVFTNSGANLWSRAFTAVDGTKPVYITLVWTDAAGFGASGFALKNDLDEYVDAPLANAHFVGNSFDENTGYSIRYVGGQQLPFDNRNNVENIVFVPNSYGIVGFQLTVFPRAIVANALPSGGQDFALFVTNAH
jgi:hypothetical protein